MVIPKFPVKAPTRLPELVHSGRTDKATEGTRENCKASCLNIVYDLPQQGGILLQRDGRIGQENGDWLMFIEMTLRSTKATSTLDMVLGNQRGDQARIDAVKHIFPHLLFVEIEDEHGELLGGWLRCHRCGMIFRKDEGNVTPTRYVLMRRHLLRLEELLIEFTKGLGKNQSTATGGAACRI